MAKPVIYTPEDNLLEARCGRVGPALARMIAANIGSFDVASHFDDFWGDAIEGKYAVVTGVDGTFTIEESTNLNGAAKVSPGVGSSADTEYAGAWAGLGLKGDHNAVFAARVALDTLATTKVEVGLTDSGADAGAVNVLATPNYTASDLAMFCRDSDDSGNANAWQGVGVKATTGITKLEPSSGAALTAGTYQTLVIALQGDAANYIIYDADGGKTYESGWQANAVEGGTALTPWIFAQNRTGSIDRLVSVDFWGWWQRRSSSN